MAKRKATVKLSEQWQGGHFKCYRKMIGGRPFFLTQDRQQSERMVMALTAAWSQIVASGSIRWSEEVISNALQVAGVIEPKLERRQGRHAGRLYTAIEEYLDDHKAKVSLGRYERASSALTLV
jgi:hypothetical protein